jgi:hypothetical protein
MAFRRSTRQGADYNVCSVDASRCHKHNIKVTRDSTANQKQLIVVALTSTVSMMCSTPSRAVMSAVVTVALFTVNTISDAAVVLLLLAVCVTAARSGAVPLSAAVVRCCDSFKYLCKKQS